MQNNEDYYNSQDFQEILTNYETSMKAGDHPFMDVDDLVDIADYYNECGKQDEALEVIEYSLELYPNATLPNVFMAREALHNGDFDAAREYAEQIEDHDDPDYHYLEAEMMVAEGKIEEADRYLRDYAKTVEPDEYLDFIKDCADLYMDYDINDKAYEWMMRGMGDTSSDFKEMMGYALLGLGRYKEAEKLFNELLDANPYSVKWWNTLGQAQLLDEDYNNAISSCEFAIAIDPQNPQALLTKANALFRLNNYEEAGKYLERYIAQSPEDDEHMDIVYQEMAFIYSAQKNLEKALEMLEKTEQLTDDRDNMLVIRGHILLENNRPDEAQEVWGRAIQESKDPSNVILHVAISMYENNCIEACYQLLKQLLRYYPKDDKCIAEAVAYMAVCCNDMNRQDEFLYYLKMAVKYDPQKAKTMLGYLFPKDTDVNDYYKFMTNKLSK